MRTKSVLTILCGAIAMVAAVRTSAQQINCSDPNNFALQECQCMEGALPKYAGSNCTANDVRVVLVGLGTVNSGCINQSDSVDIRLRATVNSGASTRYDIAWFISLQPGGTGRTGRCQPGYLAPVAAAVGGTWDPKSGVGPYYNADGNTCGEILQTDNPTYLDYQFDVTLPCANVNAGFLSIPRCVVWSNQDRGPAACSNILQTGSDKALNSKCNCTGDSTTDIPGPNLRFQCVNPESSDFVLDPGESITQYVGVPNEVSGCTPTGTPEIYQCGTAGYFKVVLEYPSTYGTLTATSNGGSDVINNNSSTGRVVWLIKNPWGTSLGVLGPTAPYPAPVPPPAGTYPAPELTYTFTRNNVFFEGQLNFTTKVYWSTTAPAGDPQDLTGWVEKSCTDCGCSTQVTTTPVTLTSFGADEHGSQVHFTWSTATEAGALGFDIYGETPDGWVKLNDQFIPSLDGDSVEPRGYEVWLDVPAGVERFRIQDVDVLGKVRTHPVVALGERVGRGVDARPVHWTDVRAEAESLAAEREAGSRRELALALRQSLDGGPRFAQAAMTGTGSVPPVELRLSAAGIYRVTYEDLLAAGFDLKGVQTQRIGLTNRGVDVPARVVGGRTFGPGSYVEFVGDGVDTLYSKENVYFLWVDAKKAARVIEDATPPPPGAPVPFYGEICTVERNTGYSSFSPVGDPWYDTRMSVGRTPRTWNFAFEINGYHAGSSPAVLDLRLFGGVYFPGKPDHHVRLWLNGVLLGDYYGDGLEAMPVSVVLPDGALREGANTLTIGLQGDLGNANDVVFLDRYSVTFPRAFHATNGVLTFTAGGSRFEVAGLVSPKAVVYRRTPQSTSVLLGSVSLPSAGGYTVAFPGGGEATYFVTDALSVKRPRISAGRPPVDITAGSAEYLVIAHPNFIGGLSPLVAARERQGLRVRVVDVRDVFAQFGHSVFDPEAIKAYVGHAVTRMGTKYVLLVGGDTFDYHDYLGRGSVSFIPSLYAATSRLVLFAPADAVYADVDGNGTPDVAIGRLPVRTQEELNRVVGKTLAFEGNNGYPMTAVFAADRADATASVPFALASDAMIAGMPAGWAVARAYLDVTAVGEARSTIIDSINRGVALTSFVGHSGPTAWTFEGLLNVADVRQLDNAGRPTIVTQWGCWNTYYVNPASESLATTFLLHGEQGAAAVLGATTLTSDVAENKLGRILVPLMTSPGVRIGDAILDAKRTLARTDPKLVDVLLGWNLLGDPALMLQR